ncbi:hypothetical protein NC653_004834 [Populus alba x Populus x berolinensis]|uniref:Uncharacterized protein n=1 Tax=Populus alba x Populus x berolinensis TaxID=444605 RepID=A0AAD6WLE1_9ROSI|nr:hypothetical protein NC653_004834 [Populus alba x Populus x berolinensis]
MWNMMLCRIVFNKFESVSHFYQLWQLYYHLRLWRERLNLVGGLVILIPMRLKVVKQG